MASSTVLHVDMDAFFAAVEQLDNPALRGRCVIVGADSRRGVVAAASYEARRYGIHSAMPIFQAKDRCPHLVIAPPRRRRYAEVSARVMSILESFSPLVEQVSIDEAYLDVSGCGRLYGPPAEMAEAIKKAIRHDTGLTCSVGIAPNKFMAKIASDLNKPDGLTLITPEQVPQFIEDLDLGKVPGVGPQARRILADMGIVRLGQVTRLSLPLLTRKLGSYGRRLMELAHGRDDSKVTPSHDAKSVSSEATFDADTSERSIIAAHLLAQAQAVARQLHRHHVRARTITLKLKTADFQRHTRARTLSQAVRDSAAIYETALELLDQTRLGKPIRLVGVAAGNLQPDDRPVQPCLFADEGQARHGKWEKIDRVVEAVADRFGSDRILRAALKADDGPDGHQG